MQGWICAPALLLLLATGCGDAAAPEAAAQGAVQDARASDPPRSVVLIIGDGMGPQQLALLMDWADAAQEAPTAFQRFTEAGVVGVVRTGAANSSVTDSAAAATALACGVEVDNGVISVDRSGEALPTCLEDASASGRRTGLVTTTRLTHATPACFAAHVPNRSMEREIARQLVASGVDVLLGGGARFFGSGPSGTAESLFDVAAAAGYAVCRTGDDLAGLAPGSGRVLGVFAASHLPYLIDRDGEGEPRTPSLQELTGVALERLGGDGAPFFLMVEAGRIDHGGHLNDVAAVLGEMREFDATLAVVERFRADHPGTLVVVTADHETGGLAVSYGPRMPTDEDYLAMARVEQSLEAIMSVMEHDEVDPAVFGVGRRNFYPQYSWSEASLALERSARFQVSYGTQGHTTTPVVVVAAGPGAGRFAGMFENEHVGRVLREFMQEKP